MPIFDFDGWSYEKLRKQRNRAHFLLDEPYRFVSVLLFEKSNAPPKLYCIDSPCYHASGPLCEGPIEDIENIPCIRCPWHHFLVSLDNGEEVILPQLPPKFDSEGVFRVPGYPGQEPETAEEIQKQREERKERQCGPAQRGRRVQRTHGVSLDESTGIMSIEIIPTEEMKNRPMKSDKPAADFKYGRMCFDIFDIKSKGIE